MEPKQSSNNAAYFMAVETLAKDTILALMLKEGSIGLFVNEYKNSISKGLTRLKDLTKDWSAGLPAVRTFLTGMTLTLYDLKLKSEAIKDDLILLRKLEEDPSDRTTTTTFTRSHSYKSKHIEDANIAQDLRDGLDTGRYLLNDPDGRMFIKLSEPYKDGPKSSKNSATVGDSDWWSPIINVREHLKYSDLWMQFLNELNSKLETLEFQIKNQTSQGPFSIWFENNNYITLKNIMEALELMTKEFNLTSISLNIAEVATTANDNRLEYLNEMFRVFLKAKPKCSIKNNVAYVNAPYLLMSQVISCTSTLTKMNSNISTIAVLASSVLYFDVDFLINVIRSPKLELGRTVELIIISPNWKLQHDDLITVGLTGRQPPDYKNLSKTQGQPGLPGEGGGRFILFAGNVSKGELLIVLDGGQGGNGQSGSHESTCIIGCFKDEVFTETYLYCCKGNQTSWHNRGVDGGQKGKGGLPGNYKTFIFAQLNNQTTQFHFQQNPGAVGDEGEGGNFSAIMDGFRCNDEAINASGITVHHDPFGYCHNIDQPDKHVVKPIDPDQLEKFTGHAGKSPIEPLDPTQVPLDYLKSARAIVKYKNWSSSHFHLFNALQIYNLTSHIDVSQEIEIRNFSRTLDLFDEFENLAKEPLRGHLGRELLKLNYQSLAARAKAHALVYNGDIEPVDDYVKFNLFLSAAARSKLLALAYPFQPTFVVDMKEFLVEEKSKILQFKAASEEQAQFEHINKLVTDYNANLHKYFKEAAYLTNLTVNADIDTLQVKLGQKIKDLLLRILKAAQGGGSENILDLEQKLQSTRMGNVAFGVLKNIAHLVNLLIPVGLSINEGVDFGNSIFNPYPGNPPVVPITIPDTVASTCSFSALRFRKSYNYTISGFKRQLDAVKDRIKRSNADLFPNALKAIESIEAVQYFSDGKDPGVPLDDFPPTDSVLSYKQLITIETKVKEGQINVSEAIKVDEKNAGGEVGSIQETIRITISVLKGGAGAFNEWEQELDYLRFFKKAVDESQPNARVFLDQLTKFEAEIFKELSHLFTSLSDRHPLSNGEFSLAVSNTKHRMESAVQDLQVELRKEFFKQTDLHVILNECAEKVEDVVETLVKFYTLFDAYKEELNLANFTNEIALNPGAQYWGKLKDQKLQKKFDELKSTVQGLVLLKRQSLVEGAFRLWNFPIVEPGLCNFKNLSGTFVGFPMHDIVVRFVKEIELRLDNLIGIVNAGFGSTSLGAKYVIKNEFNHTGGNAFYKWSNSSFSQFITSILAGVPTFLHADQLSGPPSCEAIKATRLALSFGSVDGNADREKELRAVLNQYTVSLTHGGNSFYLFANQTFVIPGEIVDFYFSFEVDANGLPTILTQTYEKLVSGDLTLSPYCTWGIQVRPIDPDQGFEPLAKYANSFDLYLEGAGLCVSKSFAVEGDYVSPTCDDGIQ